MESDETTVVQKLLRTSGEQLEPREGSVQGEVPDWLNGVLLRNGTGIYEVGEDKFEHIMDPLAIFHKFDIKDRKVHYRSRYLRSENYRRNMAANHIVCQGYGTVPVADPNKSIFRRIADTFQLDENDNTLISFYPINGEIYAASETTIIYKVDPVTLDTTSRIDLEDKVGVQDTTAHPHWDQDGTVHNVGHNYNKGAELRFYKFLGDKAQGGGFPQGEVVGTIKCDAKMSSSMIHSFAMTDNFYIYVQQPYIFHVLKLLTSKIRKVPYQEAMEWKPEMKCRFHVVDKATGKEVNGNVRYEAENFLLFHHINAYEENGHVVVDVCCYEDNKGEKFAYMKHLLAADAMERLAELKPPEARRYVLPLNVDQAVKGQNLVTLEEHCAGAVVVAEHQILCTHEDLASIGIDEPRINYSQFNGRKYQYFYGSGVPSRKDDFSSVVKVDVKSKTHLEWSEKDCYPSEPIFVPKPSGTEEDDGVVLSAVNHCEPGKDGHEEAFLLVLEAKTMTEIARVTFGLKRFPKDFHGLFIPSTILSIL